MELLDARRLTGPSVVWNAPGAILDVACDKSQRPAVIEAWTASARAFMDALGWQREQCAARECELGVSLALSAPVDALYTAVEAGEAAWRDAAARLAGASAPDFDAALEALRAELEKEINPALLALRDAAEERGVAFLSDDDEVSVGFGRGAQVWPVNALPEPASVDWAGRTSVPVGLVTGTNGKTTSVRLCCRMLREAGLNAGLSSTDWVGVNDEVIDSGDYSGPGGARTVLRDNRVDVAVLETARGGLLRRGLGVERAHAALITNIAADHLGDFGSSTIEELLDVKWTVTRALLDGGLLVLNADDERLVQRARNCGLTVAWFSLDPDNPTLAAHVADGGHAATVRDGALCIHGSGGWRQLCAVDEVPITLGGAARHNVSNALGASALALALGIGDAAVIAGLRSMQPGDNPGRANLVDVNGARVLLDFAHNPEGMAALFELASALPARRRLLAFAQAGDRTDSEIRDLARGAARIGLDRVHVSELEKYARGREPGEVYRLLRDELRECGVAGDAIVHFDEEMDAFEQALDWAAPGDLIIMLALGDGPAIAGRLAESG